MAQGEGQGSLMPACRGPGRCPAKELSCASRPEGQCPWAPLVYPTGLLHLQILHSSSHILGSGWHASFEHVTHTCMYKHHWAGRLHRLHAGLRQNRNGEEPCASLCGATVLLGDTSFTGDSGDGAGVGAAFRARERTSGITKKRGHIPPTSIGTRLPRKAVD